MDDKVNDFLNEINEIVPSSKPKQPQEEWNQCYDELTGYVYYWNKKTDKVTWDPPESYKKASGKPPVLNKNQHIPTKVEPLFPGVSSSKEIPKDIKIYSISDNSNSKASLQRIKKEPSKKRTFKKNSDSEDEKITLISSYGSDSESSEEEEKKPKLAPKLVIEDNTNTLEIAKRQTKTSEAISGDVPEDQDPKPGLSLVAGYSDSEEETETTIEETPQVSHSTLFPIVKPIDINDFSTPQEPNSPTTESNNFDNKAFQRKKRIGVTLVNTKKRNGDSDNEEERRKGLGFDTREISKVGDTKEAYKAITFVKSETLNPVDSTAKSNEDDSNDLEPVNEMYFTLREKLTFLNEGRPDISPVQSMVIQAETLFSAMNDGALKLSYLHKWLKETCSQLIKLEKEATPAGWALQWDKPLKRYFYQNLSTGESQWEYPQPDHGACDDAMDISTTPPHVENDSNNPLSPPLPPNIRSPTPPPPPVISSAENNGGILPEESGTRLEGAAQPPPPGVDKHEVNSFQNVEVKDSLNSALDSFYSDIAAISSPPSSSGLSVNEEQSSEICADAKVDSVKKKKKTKVKLAPGLVMKKKGVSKLVEKWKNLQQEYNN
ncbi:unnamed protein product [Phyllotreta striolata]|uniref:WW domain-containing protein n=1 Tax=Phyllotreta striolata TaxID=444603 RepID=A0A9N9TRR3_PHYSR|nr:unnamed protein product [Phyllotreta striolata]